MSQIYLGSDAFRRKMQRMIAGSPRSPEVPRRQRQPAPPELSQIIAAVSRQYDVPQEQLRHRRHRPERLALAYLARNEAGLRLADFAPALGIKTWAASHLAASAEQLQLKSPSFRRSLDQLRLALATRTTSSQD